MYKDRQIDMLYAAARSFMPTNWRQAGGQVVNSPEAFREFAAHLIAHGYEGAVLKPYNGDYMPGHKGWRATKIVRGISLDLACIDFELGKAGTKREGLLAKLQFKLPGGGKFWADLGRGWTDERRKELTDRAVVGDLDGVIFKVKALQMSSTGKALRLPKVEEERIDKGVADA